MGIIHTHVCYLYPCVLFVPMRAIHVIRIFSLPAWTFFGENAWPLRIRCTWVQTNTLMFTGLHNVYTVCISPDATSSVQFASKYSLKYLQTCDNDRRATMQDESANRHSRSSKHNIFYSKKLARAAERVHLRPGAAGYQESQNNFVCHSSRDIALQKIQGTKNQLVRCLAATGCLFIYVMLPPDRY